MPAVFKSKVLFLLLHLRVGPLNHGRVAALILNRMHNAHRHTINIAQIDRFGVQLTGSPALQANELLELAGQGNLSEVHGTVDRETKAIKCKNGTFTARDLDTILIRDARLVSAEVVVEAELVKFEEAVLLVLVALYLPIVVAGSKTYKSVDSVRVPVLVRGEGVEYLSTALRVAHKGDLRLSSHLEDFIHARWDVIPSHCGPVEAPSLLQTPSAIVDVVVAVWGAPVVAYPNVIALLCQKSGETRPLECTLRPIEASICGAMHHEYWRFVTLNRSTLNSCDSEHGQSPAIFSVYLVRLPFEAMDVCNGLKLSVIAAIF